MRLPQEKNAGLRLSALWGKGDRGLSGSSTPDLLPPSS
jgi:hypothetical protein